VALQRALCRVQPFYKKAWLNNPEDPELGNGLAEERKAILMPFQNHAQFICE